MKDGSFGYPPLNKTIRGTTIKSAIEIVNRDLISLNVTGVKEMDLKSEDVVQCKEMFFLQNEKVIPILQLDGVVVGDGRVGPVCLHLQ